MSDQAGIFNERSNNIYCIANLNGRKLDTLKAEGQQIRSFQLAIKRLEDNPNSAKILIYKPGPLPLPSAVIITQLADVYRIGMKEVAVLLKKVNVAPE